MIVRRSLAVVALVLVAASPTAQATTPSAPVVRHLGVTVAGVRATPDPTWIGGDGPTLALPQRARVVFTVSRKTQLAPFMLRLPRGAGRYVAFYLPSSRWGWAEVADPGSARGWPAPMGFGDGMPFEMLQPGVRYSLLVALDRATRVPMPFPMHVLSVRAAAFGADVVVQPLDLLTHPAAAALGSARNTLHRLRYTSVAVAIDWQRYLPTGGDTEGDACPGTSQTDAATCTFWGNAGYTSEMSGAGLLGGPVQLVLGNATDEPVEDPVLVGYAATAPDPFDAVTLLGFAFDPSRTR